MSSFTTKDDNTKEEAKEDEMQINLNPNCNITNEPQHINTVINLSETLENKKMPPIDSSNGNTESVNFKSTKKFHLLPKRIVIYIYLGIFMLIFIAIFITWYIFINHGSNPLEIDGSHCVSMKVPYCIKHKVRYLYTSLPNKLNQTNLKDIDKSFSDYGLLLGSKCYALLPLFLCSLYVPPCNSTRQPITPCKSFCKEAVSRCDFFFNVFMLRWPFEIDCDSYADSADPDICIGHREMEQLKKKSKTCASDTFRCDKDRCLPQSWICDGFYDCKDGTDENNCGNCTSNQLHCGNGTCINLNSYCDGIRDCPDGRDERTCLRLNELMGSTGYGILEVRSNNKWNYVCAENWSKHDSVRACKIMGYNNVVETRLRDDIINNDISSINNHLYYRNYTFFKDKKKICSKDNPVSVTLKCNKFECGKRASTTLPSWRIVGGTESRPGQWPWLISLHGGPAQIFFCGGVLISQRWVMSAAHCIGNQTDLNAITVKLGLTRRSSSSRFLQQTKVIKLIKHPGYVGGMNFDKDICLLLLEKKMQFNDYLRPVCLPTESDRVEPKQKCTVVGWGKLEHDEDADYMNVIHEVNVPLVYHNICSEWYQSHDYTIGETMLCAGYPEGKKDACQGDSGGPLLCTKKTGTWFVAGIVSWGVNCAQPNLPGVYTNVLMFLDWIRNVTNEYGEPLDEIE